MGGGRFLSAGSRHGIDAKRCQMTRSLRCDAASYGETAVILPRIGTLFWAKTIRLAPHRKAHKDCDVMI